MGADVGEAVGAIVGDAVGAIVGEAVGAIVGEVVGEAVGATVGEAVGAIVSEVVETYELTDKEFKMSRKTMYIIANTDAVYQLGVAKDEDDIILGKVKHTVTFVNNRLQETLVRKSDGAIFTGVKKINRDDEHKIIYTMNFTLPGNKGKSSCVRYFLRR